MNFFDKIGAGWRISMQSFGVLKKNKQLMILPIISSLALLMVLASFLAILILPNDGDIGRSFSEINGFHYTMIFVFYLINYFIIIFFNVALIHCARIYFQGGKPTVSDGISFSFKKFNVIFGWAAVAATVGLLLKMLEENGGKLGQILSAIIGIAWSIVTFFVVPVIAYENVGPIQAIKRSTAIMKEHWGESVGASFNFLFVQLLGLILIALPLFLIGNLFNIWMGVILGIAGLFIVGAIVSAMQAIFISAIYHKVNNQPVEDFNNDTIDGLFIKKEKKGLF